ncbi:MAG: chaperone modulator CbpM [Methylococcaceae bacterium]|nr:chaperone modulator CbpM [Methylococcaceae bacterium]
MNNEIIKTETGILIEESDKLSFVKLCRYCSLPAESVIKMVERGMVDPLDPSLSYSHWQFSSTSLLRIQTAQRLQRDLDVNLAGAVLALELLDEIKQLRQQVAFLQR